jgi:hypothetical protein
LIIDNPQRLLQARPWSAVHANLKWDCGTKTLHVGKGSDGVDAIFFSVEAFDRSLEVEGFKGAELLEDAKEEQNVFTKLWKVGCAPVSGATMRVAGRQPGPQVATCVMRQRDIAP